MESPETDHGDGVDAETGEPVEGAKRPTYRTTSHTLTTIGLDIERAERVSYLMLIPPPLRLTDKAYKAIPLPTNLEELARVVGSGMAL